MAWLPESEGGLGQKMQDKELGRYPTPGSWLPLVFPPVVQRQALLLQGRFRHCCRLTEGWRKLWNFTYWII